MDSAWPRRRQRAPHTGFTLIEVLVALAVLAITLVALIQTGMVRQDSVHYMRDRTIAGWIAADHITALRIGEYDAARDSHHGTVEMVGRVWHWDLRLEPTDFDDILRVHSRVRADGREAEPLARIEGYIPHPDAGAVR